jgi:hypothetical protein
MDATERTEVAMANKAHSLYRGCSITTRWVEVGIAPPDLLQVKTRPRAWAKGFTASFSVVPPTENDSSWQEFPQPVFDTGVHAAQNALDAAKRSIDFKLAEH